MDAKRRRSLLKTYGIGVLSGNGGNRCRALVSIIAKAVHLVPVGAPSRAATIMEDLKLVLIGDDLRDGGVWGLSLLINTQQDFRLVLSAVENR